MKKKGKRESVRRGMALRAREIPVLQGGVGT